MGIEIVHGSRPGDNAIGKRIDSIVAQQEAEKQRNMQASIEAARLNASMSAQRSSLAMRNKEVELEAAKDSQRMQLAWAQAQQDAQRQQMAFQMQGAQLGQQAQRDRQGLVMEGVRSGMIPREMGAEAVFGPQAGQAAASIFAEQDQSQMLAQEINVRQAAASQAPLNPEGQSLYRDWSSKLNAFMRASKGIRPAQSNEMRRRLIDEFDKMDLRRFQVKVPTIDEDWQQNAIQLDDGSWVVREETKNGKTWRQMGSAKKGDQKAQPFDLGAHMSDRNNYLKEWNEAAKRLLAKRENATEKDSEGKLVVKPYSYPTDQEIQAEMDGHLQRWSGSFQQGQQPQPGQPAMSPGGQPAGPPPGQPPMPPGGSPAGPAQPNPNTDTLSGSNPQGNMPPASAGASIRVTKEMREQVIAATPIMQQLRNLGDPNVSAAVNTLSGIRAAIASGQARPDDPTIAEAAKVAQQVIASNPKAQAMDFLAQMQAKYGKDSSGIDQQTRAAIAQAVQILKGKQ
jgi:hypothetical protein